MEYNKEYIISYTKETCKNLNKNQKFHCKVLKFTSEWTFVDLIDEISYIYNKKQYKNLFVFIVECDDEITDKSDRFDVLESILIKFNKNRPLVLVLSSKNANDSRVYYKNENQKLEIQPDLDDFDNCLPFFKFIKSDNAKNLQLKFLEKLPQIPGSSLILRLLRIFNFPENFYKELIQKCAIKGSVDDIVAALNIWLDNVEESMTNEAVECLTEVSYIAQSDNVSPDDVNNTNSHETETSILYLAVKNSKKDIVDFLINHCMEWIQQLPYDHQLMISTTAFNTNQLDVLCKLLDCDFPFPNKLDVDAVTDINLKIIINARTNFHTVIKADDKKSVEIFIKKNPNLKIGFNTDNDSAIHQTISCKNDKIRCILQSHGYNPGKIDEKNEEFCNQQDGIESITAGRIQRNNNVNSALQNDLVNILRLESRSFIHNNKNISKSTKHEYYNKIRSWYNDIYKTKFGCKLIDVAAQCNNLKIIYDFESTTTFNMDLRGRYSPGNTYSVSKWIFIGAKSSKVLNRDQKIKGVISHEICHFVMGLVYQNNDSPFFEYDSVRTKEFEDIVKENNKWKVKNDEESQGDDDEDEESQDNDDEDENIEKKEELDDECNGIISTVYKLYAPEDYIAELIVRGPHIQAEFDNDKSKELHLENLYKNLFEYWNKRVMPDLENFNLEKREKIKQLNKSFGLLKEIKSLDYKLSEPKNMSIQPEGNDVIIISTNVPNLLLTQLYNHVKEKDFELLDSRNVFVSLTCSNNDDNFENYMDVLKQNSNLNVFVDCTKGMDVNVKEIVVNNTNKFIFLIKNDNQNDKISKNLTLKGIKHNRVTVNYSWNDLTEATQKSLLKSEINFQGNSAMTLNQLISIGDFTQVFDDQQLNLLLEESEISINLNFVKLDDNFKDLFKPRELIKKQKNSTESVNLSQDELIKDIKTEKFILISDNAGAGKSWTMKHISIDLCKTYPDRWISYVDLKHFINDFKSYNGVPELQDFMISTVLKSLNQFEIRMFKHLYTNGKVSILFDAFDEIAPDFASFLIGMIQSVNKHIGNQLFITTRDYFEDNLSEELKINSIYKLKPLTSMEIINMLEEKLKLCDKSKKSKNYQDIARKLAQRIRGIKNRSIGSPQYLKMIVDVYESIKDDFFEITYFIIYKEFVFIQIKSWSSEQGPLRAKTNAIFQQKSINFFDLHKYFALNSYFPNQKSFCHISIVDDDANVLVCDSEIIGGGFLNKIGDCYLFIHETFREYFVAIFFIDVLEQNKSELITEDFCEKFIHFLTGQQFHVIRMFLNEGFEKDSISEIVNKHLSKFAEPFFKNVENMKNLAKLFEENCLHLEIFIIRLFKDKKRSKDVQTILSQNQKIINLIVSQTDLFLEFQDYLINHLNKSRNRNFYFRIFLNFINKSSLKSFIIKNQIIQPLIRSPFDVKYLNNFLDQLSQNMNKSELKELAMTLNNDQESLFLILFKIEQDFRRKFDIIFKFINVILSETEILKLISQPNVNQKNVMHLCMKDKVKMEIVSQIFENKNSVPKLCILFTQKSLIDGNTPLHVASYNKDTDFHIMLWKVLLETFKNREELKKLLDIKDQYGNSYIHILVTCNTAEVIEYTLQKIKENLNDLHYQEILRSNGKQGLNLLHRAAVDSKEVKTHQILWQIFRDSCNSDHEFLEILQEVDEDGDNILNLVATFSTGEIFQFMITELNSFTSREEIRNLLRSLGYASRNLLQSPACQNECLGLHEVIWKILEIHFDSSEILLFIKHLDDYGHNLLLNAIVKNTKEIKELTWNKVRKVLNNNGYEDMKSRKCDEIMKKRLKFIELTKEEKRLLNLEWIQITNSVELFEDRIQLINNRTIDVTSLKELELFMADYKIENHQILWKNLIKNCKNQEKLKKLILEKNNYGDNYIHLLVIWNTSEVIEFTLQKIKENLNDSHYQEILRSKGKQGRNLLHRAAVTSKEVKTHQILWKIFRDSCNSDDEFLEILREVEDNGDNVFHLVAIFSTGEIFQFMITELNSFGSREEIRNWLRSLGFASRNLLQSAAQENTSLELHETLWEILEIHFDSSEILHFIKHLDNYGFNVLLNVIDKNIKEIKELTWNKVKKMINSNGYEDTKCDEIMKNELKFEQLSKEERAILSLEWISIANSVEFFEDRIQLIINRTIHVESLKDLMLFIADYKIENHQILWEDLIENCKNKEKLKNLFLKKTNFGDNYINLLVTCNTAEVIEFTLQKFEENLSNSGYQEILRSKGYRGLNLLHRAAVSSKEVKTHQMLWQIFRNSCNSDDEFLEILREADEKGYSLINFAACYSDHHIMKFSIEELENITKVDELKSFLKHLDDYKQNMLQNAVINNKNLEVHKYLWQKIPTIFNSAEILDFIDNYCIDGFHILHDATYWNVKKIAEFTWSQIQIYISNKDDQVEYLTKLTSLNKNIHDLALENKSKDPEIVKWVKELMQKYEITF
ncbi:MATH and LRR domain-containing protein PFE0570w-like [Chironomus tepperi]|uniref:MATH and LRR domain-containing protein PFE0570w-like n=1 Tax=Chironomus tepperi TaxID=113505 RepID=UPI00391FC3D7